MVRLENPLPTPDASSVPVIWPVFEFRLRPAGSCVDPGSTSQITGPKLLVAANVAEYARPTNAVGRMRPVVICSVSTRSGNDWVFVVSGEPLLLTVNCSQNVPRVVGVPPSASDPVGWSVTASPGGMVDVSRLMVCVGSTANTVAE